MSTALSHKARPVTPIAPIARPPNTENRRKSGNRQRFLQAERKGNETPRNEALSKSQELGTGDEISNTTKASIKSSEEYSVDELLDPTAKKNNTVHAMTVNEAAPGFPVMTAQNYNASCYI